MKSLIGALLVCTPLFCMEGPDDKVVMFERKMVAMLEAANRALERADELKHKAMIYKGVKAISTAVSATKEWFDTGNKQAGELDSYRISQLAEDERNPELTPRQRDEAREERLRVEQYTYDRKRGWMGLDATIRQRAAGIGLDFIDFVTREADAVQEHERRLDVLDVQGQADKAARVAVAKTYIQAIRDNPRLFIGIVTALSFIIPAGIYTSKHGVESTFEYYKTPELADADKSMLSKGWFSSFGHDEDPELSDVILKPEEAQRIKETIRAIKNTAAHGGFLKNMLLFGEPGVGKTMIAQRIGRACGLHWIYFAASNLVAFGKEEAVKKLVALFRFAKKSSRKLVIIIDEIELLALDRSNEKGSDEMRTLLNTLLTYTGDAESRDYMVIGLTNRKKDLDPAFLKRCDDRIRIDVPGPVERRALIELYVGKYLLRAENLLQKDPSVVSRAYWLGQSSIEKPRIEQGALTPGELDKLSERLVGFVGRDIVQLVKQIQSSALASDNNLITKDLIERVVVTKIAEQEADHETLALPR